MILLPGLVDFNQLHQLDHIKHVHLLNRVLTKIVNLVKLRILLLELHNSVHNFYQHLMQALHALVGLAVLYRTVCEVAVFFILVLRRVEVFVDPAD
jgi:hypothetical protein